MEFPGAKVATLADAPEVCGCGSRWYLEDGGLACPLCGRRLYVATELRRVIERYGFGPQPARHLAPAATRRPSPRPAHGRLGPPSKPWP